MEFFKDITVGQLKEFIELIEATGGDDETVVKAITKKGQGTVKSIVGVSSLSAALCPALFVN